MKKYFIILVWISINTCFVKAAPQDIIRDTKADPLPIKEKLEKYNTDTIDLCKNAVRADWNYQNDYTNDTVKSERETVFVAYANYRRQEFTDWIKDAAEDKELTDVEKRQLNLLKKIDAVILEEEDYKKLITTINEMTNTLANVAICPYEKKDKCDDNEKLSYYNEIKNKMATLRNPDELLYYWNEWHSSTGPTINEKFKEYVKLMNKAANLITEKHTAAEWWQSQYEDSNIAETVNKLWKDDIDPVYTELIKYVKRKLLTIYKDKNIPDFNDKDDYIPAHLLGSMHANSWSNLYEETKPHADKFKIDFSSVKSNKFMFDSTGSFYTGVGMNSLQLSNSVIVKPPATSKKIMCDPAGFDFCDGTDYRVKMCPNANFHDFTSIHNVLGHVQYFTQYKDLNLILRQEAYPGFYEAIGGVTSLAITTPTTLKSMRLLSDYADNEEDNINALYLLALEHIPALSYALFVDKWRWDVFKAEKDDDWNTKWWDMQKEHMKLLPPNKRDDKAFDATGNHHVVADKQYLNEFLGNILKFQIFEKLCKDHFDPKKNDMHKCHLWYLETVGTTLSSALKTGKLNEYKKVLKELTDGEEISAKSFTEYFKPLIDYLKKENENPSTEPTPTPETEPTPAPSENPTTKPTSKPEPEPTPAPDIKTDTHDDTLPIVIGILMSLIVVGAALGYAYYYFRIRG